jgi:hypothetical protein
MPPKNFRYTSCYCEENIWHLAREEWFRERETIVMIISGKGRYRKFWFQRNAESPQAPVYWDYHVILLSYEEGWRVWDLDTSLGLPVPADTYFHKTFLLQNIDVAHTDVILRLVSAEEYVCKLSSDRAHMRLPSGEWAAPPPEWPMILQGRDSNLLDWLNINHNAPGRVLALAEFMHDYLTAAPEVIPFGMSASEANGAQDDVVK